MNCRRTGTPPARLGPPAPAQPAAGSAFGFPAAVGPPGPYAEALCRPPPGPAGACAAAPAPAPAAGWLELQVSY